MRPLKIKSGALPPGTSRWEPASLVATFLGVGLVPFTAGTWGSLAAMPFAWVIQTYAGWPGLIVAAAIATAAGVWASERLTARSGLRDPGFIVIDEVAGMLITLAAAPRTLWGYALGFGLFRIADILKPWPASWCDRNVHGGVGVMLDDLVAALYSCAATWIIVNSVFFDDVVKRLPL